MINQIKTGDQIKTGEGKENIQNKNNVQNILTNQKEIFQEKISNLILDENFKIILKNEKNLKRYLKNYLIKYIKQNNFGFLKKYKSVNILEEEKFIFKKEIFENKFNKYFPIHEEIFFKNLNEEIDKKEIKDRLSLENLIKNFLYKYLHILFIFSEKVKLSDLDNYLKKDLEDLSVMFGNAKNDILLLENFGEKTEKNLRKKFEQPEKIDDESIFIYEKFFSYLYRRLYKEIEENGINNTNKGKEISEKFNEEFKKIINQIFYIFETWIETGYNNEEKIRNLEIFTRKFLEGLLFLKKENIAFSNFPAEKLNDVFLENFKKYFKLEKIKSDFKEEFFLFLEYVCGEKYNNLKTELRKTIKDKEEQLANSRIPGETKIIEGLDIENTDFQEWQTVAEIQKYENVFSKVIAENGVIKFADFLQFKNDKIFEKYFEIYYEYFAIDIEKNVDKNEDKSEEDKIKEKKEKKKIFRESLEKQFKEVKNSEGISIKDFIEKDVNNLNLLILWWRFVLKIRTLEKSGKEINLDNILSLEEKEYGVVEKISELIKKLDILNLDKIKFTIDGKVRNTSGLEEQNIGLKELINSIKKGFINLDKEKIILTNGEEKVISKIKDLYIPSELNTEGRESNLERDITKILNYLDTGIDVCYKLLKNIKIDENSGEYFYLEKVLIRNNILNKNIENLDIKEKEKIQHLVEVLKFIKSRVPILEKMMFVAQNDRKTIEKNETIKNLLNQHKNSALGPEKAFKRAFEKLIGEYGGNFNDLGDLTRARVVSKNLDESINDFIKFIEAITKDEDVTNISIVDSTGEPISKPKKESGYRDIKLFLKLKSGNTVEVQFQIEEMYEIKNNGLNLESEENNNIFEKMDKEGALLTSEELKRLLQICKERNITLPTKNILQKLTKDPEQNINWENYDEILVSKNISTDSNYHIVRAIKDIDKDITKKLVRLERVLADSAWSKIVLKYLKNKEIQVD